MKEKDISKILKDADNEMINRISENFPEEDEKRKQRIFEKTAEKYDLELGSNSFIPGFEEALIGMTTGETKDIDVSVDITTRKNRNIK